MTVIAPLAIAGWYLWERAADQYASTLGFSVRAEDQSPAISLLGGITDFSGSGSNDTDILYEYLHSQDLVQQMAAELDLGRIWSRPGHDWRASDSDPVFAYDAEGTIEDLVEYWQRMVRIRYDTGTQLIEVRVLAFDPQEAQSVATLLLQKSSELINTLSDIAQEDTIRSAREDLEMARERLRAARRDVTEFRNRNQLVDPETDVAAQAGLLGELQAQLATALIDADVLAKTTRSNDPRIAQASLRIETISRRIAAERSKLGMDGQGNPTLLSEVMGQYEALVVDRKFAEESYTSALAAFDLAQAEARRKSRYLAPYIQPTIAQSSRYPERGTLLIFGAIFLSLTWLVLAVTTYALKDRH
ncbi:capsule biosynthesis protein [Pseudooceanicola algae]|uniref:capsule biosynthesis protein n=1 Tax=Pseudooceanicola algae TaxID=1537215 RepID=UPI0011C39977|nr:capsule biosynthesis protein [Pseudooceanicola algae]